MNIPLRWKIERKLNNISQSSYKEFPKQTILLSGVDFEKFLVIVKQFYQWIQYQCRIFIIVVIFTDIYKLSSNLSDFRSTNINILLQLLKWFVLLTFS